MVTFAVLKLDKSIELKETQSKNIYLISSTFEVSKLDKFTEVSFEHWENKEPYL